MRISPVSLLVCLACLEGASQAQAPLAPSAEAPPPSLEERMKEFDRRLQELHAEHAADQRLIEELRRERAAARASAEEKGRTASPAPAPVEPAKPNTDYQPAIVPFSFGDFSWAPGNYAPPDSPLSWGPFHGEFRSDVAYHYSLANPVDDTISGSSEVFRHNEFQATQLGFGGDFYYKGVQGRVMTQFGMYSQTTARNDPSAARGQWNLSDAYRYISEAYGGYHINALSGINIQAGIFMSYVGLWSYYNFDNWTYQPSYVSSNTPWFFNGARVQVFPTDRLKLELWLVNGWQAYGKFDQAPGVGLQVRWSPREWISVIGNQYYGADTLGISDRQRIHTDDSIMARLYNAPESRGLSKLAMSLTVDGGCEFGDAAHDVSCTTQYFLGFMAYARAWFYRDLFGLTFGGGAITNPGRYLVLMPPINGATAFTGSSYFTENPGDQFTAWDLQGTFDFMPNRYITFRAEYTHRQASVPYFSGHGGVTPPNADGSFVNQGDPGSTVPGWAPDLVKAEDRFTAAMMVRM